jgi:chitinase
MIIKAPSYSSSKQILKDIPTIPSYGYSNPQDCNDFSFGKLAQAPTETKLYATEHVLEFQLVKIFLEGLGDGLKLYDDPLGGENKVSACKYLRPYWYKVPAAQYITVDGQKSEPMKLLATAFPSKTQFTKDWVLLVSGVNTAKEGVSFLWYYNRSYIADNSWQMWGVQAINSDETMNKYNKDTPERAIANIKDVLSAWKYHVDNDIAQILIRQRDRVGDKLAAIEEALEGLTYGTYKPYKSLDLKSLWEAWSSGRVARAKKRAEEYMTNYLALLQRSYATDDMRKDAEKAAKDGDGSQAERIEKIDALAAAIKARPTWNMPF